jgi:hypothetical protein
MVVVTVALVVGLKVKVVLDVLTGGRASSGSVMAAGVSIPQAKPSTPDCWFAMVVEEG